MIVSERDARRITEGRKTQVRIAAHRRAPAVGRVIPITYREPIPFSDRKVPVRACYVSVLRTWETTLHAITLEEARAEGHQSIHMALRALGEKDRPLIAIEFELQRRHIPRLLSSMVVAGKQGAYVDNPARAMADEPEAVDAVTQKAITEEAWKAGARLEEEHRAVVEELPHEVAIEVLKVEARRRYIDIRDELRAYERWASPEAKARQVQVINRKLERPYVAAAA